MSNNQHNPERRHFLEKTAAAVVAAAGSGLVVMDIAEAKPADQPVADTTRWGLLVDVGKCVSGCTDCVDACNEENGLTNTGNPRIDPQWMRKVDLKDNESGREFALPMMCQHCENPPCEDVCPTGASFRRIDGIVLVDKHICIGCRYCMMACPYKARSFEHYEVHDQKPYAPRGIGTVEACTMCVHRVDAGRDPACVEACEHKAIVFGDMKDANSEIAKKLASEPSRALRGDLQLNPGVRYQGV